MIIFNVWELADWRLIITDIQSFRLAETKHFGGSGKEFSYYRSSTHVSDVWKTAVVLLCSCRGSSGSRQSFPRRSIKHSVYCVLDGRGTRRWQLKGAKLCAPASLEDTTTKVRKGHSRQFRQSCFVSMVMALWRAALVLSVRLGSNEVFSSTVLIHEPLWSSKMKVG